jgi:hypothetical protein
MDQCLPVLGEAGFAGCAQFSSLVKVLLGQGLAFSGHHTSGLNLL